MNATNQILPPPVNHHSFQNDEDTCVICLETFNNKEVRVTKCGHIFDKHCLDHWLKDHITCPNCRTPLKERAPRQQQAQHFIRDPINLADLRMDAMDDDYGAASSLLEIARFRERCCLSGLLLNGLQVTPDAVVHAYRRANAPPVELARFKEQCCLRGLILDGQQVTTASVANAYRSAEALLELARFKEQCCLRGLLLDGQQVTPDIVVIDYWLANASLELQRFREQCYLMGLILTQDANQEPEPARTNPVRNYCNIL